MLSKGRWTARQLRRARILLMVHNEKHLSNSTVANKLGCGRETVWRIRRRFLKEGLKTALFDYPRSGQPKKLTVEHEAYIIATACTDAPKGSNHWTLKLLTQKLKHRKKVLVSTEVIRKVLLKNKLKPWLKKNVVHFKNHTGV